MTAGYAVLDIECTGFSEDDRICEIAIVNLDGNTLELEDEFTSLVNPQQDTGPSWVHGISNEMVADAPRFSQIQKEIADRISGQVLVSHNLHFDRRFVKQEWDRCGGQFYPGEGICSLTITKERLVLAARRHGVEIKNMHSALGDALVTAELLAKLDIDNIRTQPAIATTDLPPAQLPPRPRDYSFGQEISTLAGLTNNLHFRSDDENVLAYMDKLTDAMEDLVLTHEESLELERLSLTLGLSEDEMQNAHDEFLRGIIDAAETDWIITPAEHRILTSIAEILDCDPSIVPHVSTMIDWDTREVHIYHVGTPHDIDGKPMTDDDFRARCHTKGIIHTSAINKMCDLVVVGEDADSHVAFEQGIPVMTYEEFIQTYEI